MVSQGWLVAAAFVDGKRPARRLASVDRPPGAWGWSALYGAAVELGCADVFLIGREFFDGGRELAGGSVECTGDQGGAWRWRLSTPRTGIVCAPGSCTDVGGQVVNVVDVPADLGELAGPFHGLMPGELVDVLHALERLLGVPWASSLGRTAERLILSTHPRARGGTLLDREPVTPAPAEGSTLEGPWSAWRRELTSAERRAKWLHVFDANAQYLAAWSTAELGHGTPTHHAGGGFDPRVAGLWRMPGLGAVRPPFGELLPRPWLDGREWFTTPTVTRALEVCEGLEVPDVVESWRWPSCSRFLRGAGERLRDARAAATRERDRCRLAVLDAVDSDAALEAVRREVSAEVALEAVKGIYRVQTGRFGMAGRDAASPWARPDWGHVIRAQARVNLHRRLAKLTAAPFAVATDALLYLVDEPDAGNVARRLGLTIGGRLGEFHHAGSIATGELEAEILASAKPTTILKAARQSGAVVYG